MAIEAQELKKFLGETAAHLWPIPEAFEIGGERLSKERLNRWLAKMSADLHAVADNIEVPSEFYVDLNPISKSVANFVREKGFYTPSSLEKEADLVLSKLMLVVSELAEAAEAVRMADAQGAIDREEKGNFAEEMADALIRMYDLCGNLGIDLGLWVEKKMAKNTGRPYKHGKIA